MMSTTNGIPTAVVQLGYCVPINTDGQWEETAHHGSNWNNWDGGQVGGRPSWLDPAHIPKHPLDCPGCGHILRLLCQLYAPLDDDNEEENITAFHRSIYVFGCHRCPNSIRVLRTQLPRDNPYWPFEGTEEETDESRRNRKQQKSCCVVCGWAATGVCPVQKRPFCGKAHQKLYKKYNGSRADDATPLPPSPWKSNGLLPYLNDAHEMVVEDEPPALIPSSREDHRIPDNRATAGRQPLFACNDGNDGNDDSDDSDEDIDQNDLNEIVTGRKQKREKGSESDETYQTFLDRIQERSNCRDQVLRYCRWQDDAILWMRSDQRPPDPIPPCPYCGADRRFEFQIMPQLHHYLTNRTTASKNSKNDDKAVSQWAAVKDAVQQTESIMEQAPPELIPPQLVERKEEAIANARQELLGGDNNDWGTIVVYTCINSCTKNDLDDDLGAYLEEFAWIQEGMDV